MLDTLIQYSLDILGPYKGGLLNALVWGVSSGVGWGTYDQFKQVGILHVLVASGANVVFLVEAVVNILAWTVGRKKSIVFGLIIGWGYALSVGFGPPLIRGVLFVTLRYLAILLGRGFSWSRATLLVLLISFMADSKLFFSDSMWLSVSAFVGIASFSEIYKLKGGIVVQELAKGIWINAWVLPLVALKFGTISLVSPVLGAVSFWIFEPLVLLGAVAGLVYHFVPMVGLFVFHLADILLDCLIWFVRVFLGMPGSGVEIGFGLGVLCIWYSALLLIYLTIKNRSV